MTTFTMASSKNILLKEYKNLAKEKWVKIDMDEDDIYRWNLALIVLNPDSLYYGGYFKAQIKFPGDYPYKPPDFRFTRTLWHPNIYSDGRLCISILHAPGEDSMSGETAGERWSPVQGVESVLISILSLLDDAEISSPANVDASVQLRDHKEAFIERVKEDVAKSKEDVPAGFIMPTHESTMQKPVKDEVGDDFWADSDVDEDFFEGGSDSDEDLNHAFDDEDDEDNEDAEEGDGDLKDED